jgi:hypothetical protein
MREYRSDLISQLTVKSLARRASARVCLNYLFKAALRAQAYRHRRFPIR